MNHSKWKDCFGYLLTGFILTGWGTQNFVLADHQMRIAASLNDGKIQSGSVVLAKGSDAVLLHLMPDGLTARSKSGLESKIQWKQIVPVYQEYCRKVENALPYHSIAVKYESKLLDEKGWVLDIRKVLGSTAYGTYYFQGQLASPEKGEVETKNSFYSEVPLYLLKNQGIVQVVIRKDDSYIGYLTELMNTPFILGPSRTPSGIHQTDSRMGCDCAAFAIYGKRREGFQVPYCGPQGIYCYLEDIAQSELQPDREGIYRDSAGKPFYITIKKLAPGDILHFKEQVSVFYKDMGILGVLDKDDLVIQSYGTGPYITTLEKNGFYGRKVRAMRWNSSEMKVKKALIKERTDGTTL